MLAGAAAPAYGWNCLMFEGPGQWSALKTNPGLTFRPDYEKPVGAVVDYLLTRSDVDPGRLAKSATRWAVTWPHAPSSHCQTGGWSYAQTVIFDWLNHILDGGPAPALAAPAAAELFISRSAKYGKAQGEIKAKQLLGVAQLI